MQDLGISVLFQGTNFLRLLGGLWITIKISLISAGLSIVLGVVMGMIMTMKNPVVKAICRVYLEFIRIMPQLVLLFLVYFGLTRAFGWNLSGTASAILVFTLWGTAELGDLVRGALQSIPKHQRIGHDKASDLPLCDYSAGPPPADPPGHQPHHPHGQNHKSRGHHRRCGGSEGWAAGHRRQPLCLSHCGTLDLRRDLFPVFLYLLADLSAGKTSGEEMERSVMEELKISGLVKSYGEDTILNGLDLTIQKGEVAVILGPSGCGKSTLLRCINGLETINAGSITLDGETISGQPKALPKIRQRIGMVFQSYDLFPHKTILDNITLAPIKVQKRQKKEVEAEAETLLKRVGLLEKKDAYPRQLSGGQKQRVAIVRSLCMHPEIMLFDEVTAALDPEMVREVLDVILELAQQGLTMLIVTHEMQFARAVADRIIFIDGGKIVEEAPPEEFFTAPKTQRAQAFLSTFTFGAPKHKQ